MDKLIHFLVFFGIYASVLIALAPWIRRSLRARILFSAGWGLYLTVQVTFFHTMLPLRSGEQLASIGWGSTLIEKVHGSRSKALQFVDSSCTLIDVSYDQTMVPDPELGDSTLQHAITDRAKLTNLLHRLAMRNDLFDVVVLDVYFKERTATDDSLANALQELASLGKLAMAYDHDLCTNERIYNNTKLGDAYGGITEERIEDIYFQHTLLTPSTIRNGAWQYSLPYRAYAILEKLGPPSAVNRFLGCAREHGQGGADWITIRHAPLFLSGPQAAPETDTHEEVRYEAARTKKITGPAEAELMGRVLRDIAADPNNALIYDVMALRDRISKHHIVFIGNFNDPERDVHNTVQGTMHGALMSVNIIHELLEHRHRGFLYLVPSLWLILSFLTYMLVVRCMHDKAPHAARRNPVWDLLTRVWHSLVVEERHYWYLFALLLILQVWQHRVVNMMALVLLFAIMEFIFRSWLPTRHQLPH